MDHRSSLGYHSRSPRSWETNHPETHRSERRASHRTSPYPPTLTLQRPSIPHNHLPPIEHVYPGSSPSTPALAHRPHLGRSETDPHSIRQWQTQASTYTGAPPSPSYCSQPQLGNNPPPSSRNNSTRSPSNRSPSSFNLSEYCLTEDKAKSLSPLRPDFETDRSLPPLRLLSSAIQRPLTPTHYRPDSSGRHDYRGEEHRPYRTPSAGSDPRPITPLSDQYYGQHGEPSEEILVKIEPKSYSPPPAFDDWQRRGSIASLLLPPKQAFSIPPQHYAAYTMSFQYNPSNPAQPQGSTSNERSAVFDAAMSSLRSSADQPSTSGPEPDAETPAPPQFKFTDEAEAHSPSSHTAEVLKEALERSQAAMAQNLASVAPVDAEKREGDVHMGSSREGSDAGDSRDVNMLAPPSDSDTPRKDQPFSRSPELRVSHKLAERQRRKQMKDMFDELQDQLPSDRVAKSSKSDILVKTIDHIKEVKRENATLRREVERLRRDLDQARGGNGSYQPGYEVAYTLPYPNTSYVPPQPGPSTSTSHRGIGVGNTTGVAPDSAAQSVQSSAEAQNGRSAENLNGSVNTNTEQVAETQKAEQGGAEAQPVV